MTPRNLTEAEIAKLAGRKNVKAIAIENFLGSMDTARMSMNDHLVNLGDDARAYKWNAPTQNAIRAGIFKAYGRD